VRKFSLLKLSKHFCFLFFFFLFFAFAKPALADCTYERPYSCWIFATCYETVTVSTGAYICDGSSLKQCSSSGSLNLIYNCANGGLPSGASGQCVSNSTTSYCSNGMYVLNEQCGQAGLQLKNPVGITRSYSASYIGTCNRNHVSVSNGGWHQEGTSNLCVNNNNSKARNIDCQFLEGGGVCEWSSSQGQCVPKIVCGICTNNSNYCWTHQDNCGDWICPGTKPDINGGWSAWSTCSTSGAECGFGTQERRCNNPYPQCDGLDCLKLDGTRGTYESRSCTVSCPSGQNCINNFCQTPLNGACTSPIILNRCHSGIIGTGDGSQNCVDRYGVCQTNGGVIPPTGASCTLNNGVAGTYVAGLCGGIYNNNYKCCVPNSSDPAGNSRWMCRGDFGGTNATCSCIPASNGNCGSSDGGTFSSTPSSGLCNVGSASVVSSTTTSYTWTCYGTSGTCNVGSGSNDSCSAIRDNPPTTPTVNIRTTDSTTNIPADLNPSTGLTNSNHICQSNFTSSSNPTTVRFVVTYTDPQGGGDIASITLRIGSYSTTDSTLSVSGNTATAVFDLSTASVPSLLNNLSLIQTSASDDHTYTGSVTALASSNRYFKFWNCNVSSSGTGYDGSLSAATCSAASFDPANAISFPYSLTMVGTGTPSVAMTVNSPNYSGNLVWGKSYVFNSDVPATNFKLRFNNDDSVCTSTIQFTIDKTKSNPYVNPALLDIDFTSILDQDPWWQARGGGAISNNILNNQVPVTCTTNCKVSTNGLVSSINLYNEGLASEEAITYSYVGPSAKLANVNENYNHFKTEYYTKNEIGSLNLGTKTVTKTDDFGSDPNNIYFIEGDLNINGNIALGTRNFLMIIVSGNVTISNTVTQVDGILVANRITAAGENATALTFNGSIYAADYIDFTRGFTSGTANNAAPAVILNHNPSLLFNIPGKIAKILTSWQWGNN